MPLDYDVVKNWAIPDVRQAYAARDTILYNLGVGAGITESSADVELDFIWEARLKALPTMAAVLGEGPQWMRDPGSTITWTNLVHGEQSIEWHQPVPAAAEIVARSEVEEIYDKGAEKGAIMKIKRTVFDAATDAPIATSRSSVFMRADGGFGGTAAAPPVRKVPADRPADAVVALPTRPEQALIYRLSGDYYELHVEPDFARRIGFDRPILHGLATYGVACRALLATLCDNEPERLKRLDVRFSSPVYPGDEIVTEIWRTGSGEASFLSTVDGRKVLDNGYAQFEQPA